jgi:hypothetical protein
MQMFGVLAPLVQGLMIWQDDDTGAPQLAQRMRTAATRAMSRALVLRDKLTAVIRWLVKPPPDEDSLPSALLRGLSAGCDHKFQDGSQQCIAEFYDHLMNILHTGLSGMHSKFAAQFILLISQP